MRFAVHPLNANGFMFPIISGLPISDELPTSAADKAAPALGTNKQNPLVLIYSRDKDTRFLYRTLLDLWNYRVETAETLDELAQIARRTRPCVLLMDTILPFGESLAKIEMMLALDIFKNTPIVMLSGYSQPRYRALALSHGASDFLVKPVDFDLLEDCLKRNIKKGDREKSK